MSTIFREEVIHHRRFALQGEIDLAVPLGWHLFSILLLSLFMLVLGVGAFLPLPRIATAAGLTERLGGNITILASGSGTVSRLAVKEGDLVHQGQRLFEVRNRRTLSRGNDESFEVLGALGRQKSAIDRQLSSAATIANTSGKQITTRLTGLSADIADLAAQRELQTQIIKTTEEQLSELQGVLENGFVSKNAVRARRMEFISQRMRLIDIDRSITAKKTELDGLRSDQARLRFTSRGQQADLEGRRAALDAEEAKAEAAAAYMVEAPRDGQIFSLAVRVGSAIEAGQPLLTMGSAGDRLRAVLNVSAAQIGQIRVGQRVVIAVDSLPASRFGYFKGVVEQVPRAPVPMKSADASPPYYRVLVRLRSTDGNVLSARNLAVGLSLQGRIALERRTLFEIIARQTARLWTSA